MEDKLELLHIETMQENGLTVESLPPDIHTRLMALQMMQGRYAKAPTENLKNSIERASANIGHAIMDFVEKDLPEEDVAPSGLPIEQPATPPAATTVTPPVEQPATTITPPIEQPATPPTPPKKASSGGLFDFFMGG
jgi:hypothetical protein